MPFRINGENMIYKVIEPEKVVKIQCTLEEYRSIEFEKELRCAGRSKPDKIIIEIKMEKQK